MKITDHLRLKRLQALGLIKGYDIPVRRGAPILVNTAASGVQALRPSEVEAYAQGVAHGAWAVHTGVATLPKGKGR